jgi:hypothetical protein
VPVVTHESPPFLERCESEALQTRARYDLEVRLTQFRIAP